MLDLAELQRRKALGHQWVQVVVNRKRRPKTNRVRVMAGVLGRCIGPLADLHGTYLVDVLIEDMIRAMDTSEGSGAR